jgi:hypothetical protein
MSATASLRVGDNVNCVLRSKDAADQLTPIPGSTAVNYAFREVQVDVAELNRMGYAISAVGDVNDDGINDVLIGGTNRAYLYFGSTNVSAKTTPDVTFSGAPGVANREFGTRLAALGDINGDGTNDFAIGYPSFSPTSPSSVAQSGAVYVFYGRKTGDAWPLTVDVTSTDTAVCGADVCFYGEQVFESVGWVVAPAGDFNNDGRPDIIITAPNRDDLGRLYVVMGQAFQTAPSRPTEFWNVAIRLPSGDPIGFFVDGAATSSEATSSEYMGSAAAPVGNSDGVAGADLLVTSFGLDPSTDSAKLFFLSGRANNGMVPRLNEILSSSLTVKDTGGDPFVFGASLVPLRNWYDSGQTDIPDVAVFENQGDSFHVYLGDNAGGSTFSRNARITVSGAANNGFANAGLSVGSGYNPSIGSASRSDIDGDGLDDLCVGTAPMSGSTPIYVFYGSDVPASLSSNTIAYTSASQLNPSARTGTTWRTVQPVGDITGDGKVDLIVGEPNANSNNGGFTILY